MPGSPLGRTTDPVRIAALGALVLLAAWTGTVRAACEAAGADATAYGVEQVARVTALFGTPCNAQTDRNVRVGEAEYCEVLAGTAFPILVRGNEAYYVTAEHVLSVFERRAAKTQRSLRFALRLQGNCMTSGRAPDFVDVSAVGRRGAKDGSDIALLRTTVAAPDTFASFGVEALRLRVSKGDFDRSVTANRAGLWGFPLWLPNARASFVPGHLQMTDLKDVPAFLRWSLVPSAQEEAAPGMSGGPLLLYIDDREYVAGITILEMRQDGRAAEADLVYESATTAEQPLAKAVDAEREQLPRAAVLLLDNQDVLDSLPDPVVLDNMREGLRTAAKHARLGPLQTAIAQLLQSPELAIALARMRREVAQSEASEGSASSLCSELLEYQTQVVKPKLDAATLLAVQEAQAQLVTLLVRCQALLTLRGRGNPRFALYSTTAWFDEVARSEVALSTATLADLADGIGVLYRNAGDARRLDTPAKDLIIRLSRYGGLQAATQHDAAGSAAYHRAALKAIEIGLQLEGTSPDFQRVTLELIRGAGRAQVVNYAQDPGLEPWALTLQSDVRDCSTSFYVMERPPNDLPQTLAELDSQTCYRDVDGTIVGDIGALRSAVANAQLLYDVVAAPEGAQAVLKDKGT